MADRFYDAKYALLICCRVKRVEGYLLSFSILPRCCAAYANRTYRIYSSSIDSELENYERKVHYQ